MQWVQRDLRLANDFTLHCCITNRNYACMQLPPYAIAFMKWIPDPDTCSVNKHTKNIYLSNEMVNSWTLSLISQDVLTKNVYWNMNVIKNIFSLIILIEIPPQLIIHTYTVWWVNILVNNSVMSNVEGDLLLVLWTIRVLWLK